VPADVHLIVAADATDTIANIILDKAEDLPAALVVMASSGKQGLVVSRGKQGRGWWSAERQGQGQGLVRSRGERRGRCRLLSCCLWIYTGGWG
jgi:hypothetical protein